MNSSRLTSAMVLAWISAITLPVSVAILIARMFGLPTSTYTILLSTATGTVAVICGVLSLWLFRLPSPVAVLGTISAALVAATLVFGCYADLADYLGRGYNSIGGGLLLLLGMVTGVPAAVGAWFLAIAYRRRRARLGGADGDGRSAPTAATILAVVSGICLLVTPALWVGRMLMLVDSYLAAGIISFVAGIVGVIAGLLSVWLYDLPSPSGLLASLGATVLGGLVLLGTGDDHSGIIEGGGGSIGGEACCSSGWS